MDSCEREGHKFIISPSWSKVRVVVHVVCCYCGHCIDCHAPWKLTWSVWIVNYYFKNDCLPLLHRGFNSEFHAICGLLFFCLKGISLCGQLPSRQKQKHYLYYHLTCGLHNILMYFFSTCLDGFFTLHASWLTPRIDLFFLRYRFFEKHLKNRGYLTN